jgi:hypothetical protein
MRFFKIVDGIRFPLAVAGCSIILICNKAGKTEKVFLESN